MGSRSTPPKTLLSARKTADEAVTSSAALQNDDELLVALDAGKHYAFRATLIVDGSQAGDIKIAFTVPSGATIVWGMTGLVSSATAVFGSVNMSAVTASGTAVSAGAAGAGSKTIVMAAGTVIVGATAGNLQLQWAQATSDGTATTVYTNSTLIAEPIV